MRHSLILFILSFAVYWAATFKVTTTANAKDIMTALNKADADTLVLWDIDEVLVVPADRAFNYKNTESNQLYAYVEKLKKRHCISEAEAEKIGSQIYVDREERRMEDAFLGAISQLKKRGVKQVAITKWPVGELGVIKDVPEWRLGVLKRLGIDFSDQFKGLEKLNVEKVDARNAPFPEFHGGVLFCSRASKGDVLGAFLDSIDWSPKKVIFIDDYRPYIDSVRDELNRRGIDLTAFWFVKKELRPWKIDPAVVQYQYDYLAKHKRWIGEKEAEAKLRQESAR